MKEKLFLEAFKKAERQSGKTTKNGIASHLEKVFDKEFNFTTSKATFSRYYEQYIEKRSDKDMNPSTDLLDKLAEYLDFDNYEDFIKKNESQEPLGNHLGISTGTTKIEVLKKYKYYFIVVFILIATYSIFELTEQRWMVWNEIEYIEVDFDLEKYDFNQLEVYDEDKVKNFKKVIVNCDSTEFFKLDGTANIWYGKNQKKELQYFSALDHHPETGKTLKRISQHMIDNHICQKDSLTIQDK